MNWSAGFLILFAFPLLLQASFRRCEDLFQVVSVNNTQIENAARNLAQFRLDAIADQNPDRKDLLLKEFNVKMAEFLKKSSDADKARILFQTVYEDIRKAKQDPGLDSLRKLNTRHLENEFSAIQKWTRFFRFQPLGKDEIGEIILTPDGSKIFVTDGSGITHHVYDSMTLQELPFPYFDHYEFSRSFSADGSTLFLNHGPYGYRLIDLRAMTERPAPKLNLPKKAGLGPLTLTSDGSKLIYTFYNEKIDKTEIKMFDLHKNRHIPLQLDGFSGCSHLYLSHDDSTLIVEDGTSVPLFYDLKTQTEILKGVFPVHDNPRFSISSDRRQGVISWTSTDEQVFIDLVHLTAQKSNHTLGITMPQYIPGTDWVVESMKGKAYIFDPISKNSSPEITFPEDPELTPNLIVSSTGESIFAVFDHQIKLFGTDFTERPFEFPKVKSIEDYHLTPDGKKLIVKVNGNEMIVFFKDPREAEEFDQHRGTP